jgi:acyl dehydratase
MKPLDSGNQRYFEDVRVGEELPPIVNVPTTATLFRFSAVTWNAHRIHYDREFAQQEGHDDVLVQAHLHGAYLARMVTQWMGPSGRLLNLDWKNVARAYPLDILTCSGVVKALFRKNDAGVVEVDLLERNQDGQTCVSGSAAIALRCRSEKPS